MCYTYGPAKTTTPTDHYDHEYDTTNEYDDYFYKHYYHDHYYYFY